MANPGHLTAVLLALVVTVGPVSAAAARPSRPARLHVSKVTRTSVTVVWKRAGGRRLAGFELYVNGRRVAFVQRRRSRQHRFRFSKLTCATRYRLTARSRDVRGRRSRRSRLLVTTKACRSKRPQNAPTPPKKAPSAPKPKGDTQPPGGPAGLAVSQATQTALVLTWSASSDDVGVTGYAVFLDGNRLPQTVTSTSATFSGLTCGTTHTLAVQALDAAGNGSPIASLTASTAACPPPPPTCPANPLVGVQRPGQLTVLDPADPCRTVTGRVSSTAPQHDGDCHVNVMLDPPYRSLLNSVNQSAAGGNLITEVIPSHRLPIPRTGSRVSIFGTWVNDKATGWNELHPIWSLDILSGTTGTC